MKKAKRITCFIAAAMLAAFAMSTPALAAQTGQTTTASVSFTQGTLDLVAAPAFDFGTNAIPSAPIAYDLQNGSGGLNITDARGSGSDWSVTAELGEFVGTDNSKLTGTSIILSNASVVKGTGVSGADPVANSTTIATGGQAQKVFESQASGVGTWTASWTGSGAKLKLDSVSGIKAQDYEATMDWLITVAP